MTRGHSSSGRALGPSVVLAQRAGRPGALRPTHRARTACVAVAIAATALAAPQAHAEEARRAASVHTDSRVAGQSAPVSLISAAWHRDDPQAATLEFSSANPPGVTSTLSAGWPSGFRRILRGQCLGEDRLQMRVNPAPGSVVRVRLWMRQQLRGHRWSGWAVHEVQPIEANVGDVPMSDIAESRFFCFRGRVSGEARWETRLTVTASGAVALQGRYVTRSEQPQDSARRHWPQPRASNLEGAA